jgi:hypothetical protein
MWGFSSGQIVRSKALRMIGQEQYAERVLLSCSSDFGLTVVCSRWQRPCHFGFCWNWDRLNYRPKAQKAQMLTVSNKCSVLVRFALFMRLSRKGLHWREFILNH